MITGGEPLLAIDELEYFIDRIVESDYSTSVIDFVTNGTIKDNRVINILEKFCNSKTGREAVLSISDDQFHDTEISKEAFDFYQDAAKNNPHIKIIFNGEIGKWKDDGVGAFILSGRGQNLSNPDIPFSAIREESVTDHRICIGDKGDGDKWVVCKMQINANGDVALYEQRSFDTLDSMAIGNILITPLSDIINRFNSNCMMICKECRLLEFWTGFYRYYDIIFEKSEISSADRLISVLIADIAVEFIRRTITVRELMHKRWPAIPAQVIIDTLPIPDIALVYNNILQDIVEHSDVISDEEIILYNGRLKQTALRAIAVIDNDKANDLLFKNSKKEQIKNLLRLIILLNKPNANIATNRFFGSGDIDNTPEIQTLAKLNSKYSTGEYAYENTKVYCDMNWDPKDYCQKVADNYLNEEIAKTLNSLKEHPILGALAMLFFGTLNNS